MKCSESLPCLADTQGTRMIKCVDGECKALVNAGDQCDSSNLCYGGLQCTDGRCVAKKLNESCTAPYSADVYGLVWRAVGQVCEFGTYCDTTTLVCESLLSENNTCGAATQPCGSGLVCDRTQMKCIPLYSKRNASCISGVCYLYSESTKFLGCSRRSCVC